MCIDESIVTESCTLWARIQAEKDNFVARNPLSSEYLDPPPSWVFAMFKKQKKKMLYSYIVKLPVSHLFSIHPEVCMTPRTQ